MRVGSSLLAIRAVRPRLKTYPDEPKCARRKRRVQILRLGLKDLGRYVRNSSARIANYGARKRAGLRLSTIKYEEVYLRAYASVSEARASLGRYLAFYNAGRPHSSLDRQTPDAAYFNTLQPIPAAA